MAIDPSSPKEDRDDHSKPSCFNIVTLTPYGSDLEAESIAEALAEKAGRSDCANSSTNEIAERRSSAKVRTMIGIETSTSFCARLKASIEDRDWPWLLA